MQYSSNERIRASTLQNYGLSGRYELHIVALEVLYLGDYVYNL